VRRRGSHEEYQTLPGCACNHCWKGPVNPYRETLRRWQHPGWRILIAPALLGWGGYYLVLNVSHWFDLLVVIALLWELGVHLWLKRVRRRADTLDALVADAANLDDRLSTGERY
jgi:hypothetical protein